MWKAWLFCRGSAPSGMKPSNTDPIQRILNIKRCRQSHLVSDLFISIHFYSFLFISIHFWYSYGPFQEIRRGINGFSETWSSADTGSSTCSSGCSSREIQRHCLFQSAAWFKECVRVGQNWGTHEPTNVVIFSIKPSRFANSIDPYSSASVCERILTPNLERLDQTWPTIVIVQVISSQPYLSWSEHPCWFLHALKIAAGNRTSHDWFYLKIRYPQNLMESTMKIVAW